MSNATRRPGDPIDAADYAFAWRAMEPRPDTPTALLVLLHGADGDELQLAGIGARTPPDTLVALPRGPRSIAGGRIGWYRVGVHEDGLQVVEDEAEDALARLTAFIAQLQRRFDVAPARTWLAGFSQGAMLAAAAMLAVPARVAGVAMVSGRLPTEAEGDVPCADGLSHLRVLLVHGRDDATIPLADAIDAKARFEALGIATELEVQPAEHVLEPGMEDTVATWLAARLRTAG